MSRETREVQISNLSKEELEGLVGAVASLLVLPYAVDEDEIAELFEMRGIDVTPVYEGREYPRKSE